MKDELKYYVGCGMRHFAIMAMFMGLFCVPGGIVFWLKGEWSLQAGIAITLLGLPVCWVLGANSLRWGEKLLASRSFSRSSLRS